MGSDRPVFVVGCARSGTTLLSLMLHAHPNIAIPPESRFLVYTWRRRKEFPGPETREQREALASTVTRWGSKVRELGLDPPDLRQKILDGPPTLGSAFGVVFREFAQLHGKARWGDKRPVYYQEVDVLLRLFPDAQIVHMMRDGRANVASLNRMPWWRYDSVTSMATWSLAEYCMRRNQRRLPADTFYVIRYEALVADPEGELRKLCAFLDEDFHEAMLHPQRVTSVVPERKHWHESLQTTVNDSAVDSWRTELEPWEIGLMETVLRRKLRRNGYKISGAGKPPTFELLRQYISATRALRGAVLRRWDVERREAATATYPVAAQLTSRQVQLASAAEHAAGTKVPGTWVPGRQAPRPYRAARRALAPYRAAVERSRMRS